jgi:hypothetical protein
MRYKMVLNSMNDIEMTGFFKIGGKGEGHSAGACAPAPKNKQKTFSATTIETIRRLIRDDNPPWVKKSALEAYDLII